MRVVCLVGSMRRGKNTDTLVQATLEAIPNVVGEIVCAGDLRSSPCRVVCSDVCASGIRLCAIDDDVPRLVEKMAAADAVVLAAPQYFRAPPAAFHVVIERLISMAFYRESRGCPVPFPLLGKPCGLIAVAEYSNPQAILEYLRDAALLLKMRPIGVTAFPYVGVGGHAELDNDSVFRPFERARELGLRLADAFER